MTDKRIKIEPDDQRCEALFNSSEFDDRQPPPCLPQPQPEGGSLSLPLLLLPGLLVWAVAIALLWSWW